MQHMIERLCKKLEQENTIKILVAVESGSRAWGMASETSDFDVRFIFKRSLEEYVQIHKPSEVITAYFDQGGNPCRSQEALIDVQGFDVFKYVKLLFASNPTAIEWAISPIVYFGKQNPVFTTFARSQFNPRTLYQAYKGICKANYLKFIQSRKEVTQKTYLYVLRGLVNAKWVEWKKTIPPMKFIETITTLQEQIPSQIVKILRELVKDRAQRTENERIQLIPELNEYVETFLQENFAPPERIPPSPTELDKELQRILFFNVPEAKNSTADDGS